MVLHYSLGGFDVLRFVGFGRKALTQSSRRKYAEIAKGLVVVRSVVARWAAPMFQKRDMGARGSWTSKQQVPFEDDNKKGKSNDNKDPRRGRRQRGWVMRGSEMWMVAEPVAGTLIGMACRR
jgi:hypothetical protein